jgi:hypothetical protein
MTPRLSVQRSFVKSAWQVKLGSPSAVKTTHGAQIDADREWVYE